MSAVTLGQAEAHPDAYPVVTGLSAAAAAIDAEHVWRRIEAYIARRWTPRGVVWIVEGPGEWVPPIAPAVIVGVAVWHDGAWGPPNTVVTRPLGLSFDAGQYQVTATVGDAGDVLPGDVAEAFRRLADYLADDEDMGGAGVSRYDMNLGGELQKTLTRRADHRSHAIINSGAADLLRPYRRP